MLAVNSVVQGALMNDNLVLSAKNIVGESIVWDKALARLVWVDIIGRRIESVRPRSDSRAPAHLFGGHT